MCLLSQVPPAVIRTGKGFADGGLILTEDDVVQELKVLEGAELARILD